MSEKKSNIFDFKNDIIYFNQLIKEEKLNKVSN
jgi:hypothetical protein